MLNPTCIIQIGRVVKVTAASTPIRTDRFDTSPQITTAWQNQLFFSAYPKRCYYHVFIPNNTSYRAGFIRATDVDEVFAKGGAMEALLEMKEQKVVRFLGLTGHYRPDALIEGIQRYPFDTILMAMNAADPHFYSFNSVLLPRAVERQMGIIGMKVPARGRLLSNWTPEPLSVQAHMWEGMVPAPTSGTLTMREAMYYTLSRPVSTIIIGCDTIAQLEENVNLAREFTPLSDTQADSLVARAEPVAKPSLFFRFYDRP